MWVILRLHQLRDEFIGYNDEDHNNAEHLSSISGMLEVDDAQTYSNDFAGGDYEWNEVLFELFNHSVDEHLSYSRKSSHQKEMD